MEKRLFIGIKIEPSDELLNLRSLLKKDLKNSDVKWVESNNLHLTLMFLGNVAVEKIPEIGNKLQNIVKSKITFNVNIVGLGQFKKNNQTNVIWVGIKEDNLLKQLAESVINEMVSIGFEAEKRSFKPHLTLGRVKSFCEEYKLKKIVEDNDQKVLQSVSVNEIILFESQLKYLGSAYYKLQVHKLGT